LLLQHNQLPFNQLFNQQLLLQHNQLPLNQPQSIHYLPQPMEKILYLQVHLIFQKQMDKIKQSVPHSHNHQMAVVLLLQDLPVSEVNKILPVV